MKKQNKAAAEIVNALDALGYSVDKVVFKASGDPENNPYVIVNVRISRQGYPPEASYA